MRHDELMKSTLDEEAGLREAMHAFVDFKQYVIRNSMLVKGILVQELLWDYHTFRALEWGSSRSL